MSARSLRHSKRFLPHLTISVAAQPTLTWLLAPETNAQHASSPASVRSIYACMPVTADSHTPVRLLEAKLRTKRRNDTMVGTKAMRLPASLCSLEYLRILPASRNCNKSAIPFSLCLHAHAEVLVAHVKLRWH